jgi:hypothetical protein
MTDQMHEFFLIDPGPRPPYFTVGQYLWGTGCDVDSDGDSDTPASDTWTELTLTRRPAYAERVDVEPVEGRNPLTLRIRSTTENLARRTAAFLHDSCGGELRESLS